MNILTTGNYIGTKIESHTYNNLIVSTTEYCGAENKGWHCHENSFFAYFLKGGNYEYRKSGEIKCTPGTLLFYNEKEPHCNKGYTSNCKILHVEMDKNWVYNNELQKRAIEADVIDHIKAKNIFNHIIDEFFIADELSGDSIENLLLYLWNSLVRINDKGNYIPRWVKQFNKIKNESIEHTQTLSSVAKQLNIHPVTLSKEFPQYYHCSFSDFIRQSRIEKSLPLLAKKNIPVKDVAFTCGFSDTSNYIRSFKRVKGITPAAYRQML